VTVGGEVERSAGPRAFTLDGGFGAEDLLVLGAPPRQAGEQAVVTGQVRLLDVAEVERDLGWDLETELEVEFAQQPVLIASVPAPRAQAGGPAAGTSAAPAAQPAPGAQPAPRAQEPADRTAQGDAPPITDVAAIADAKDASSLVGRPVRLDGVPVAAVIADRGFWLGGPRAASTRGSRRAWTRARPNGRWTSDKGQQRTVSGTVEKLPPIEQMKTEWGLSDSDASKVAEGELYVRVDKLEETLRDVPPANAR
jgi:hypothetical protein